MKSFLVAGAAVAAFAAPALAGDTAANQAAVGAHGVELAQAYNAKQARQLLVSQGYTAVSELEAINGRWIGTAVKDGKTLIVGVNLPRPAPTATN